MLSRYRSPWLVFSGAIFLIMFAGLCNADAEKIFKQEGWGAVPRAVGDKQAESISSKDFGTVCNGLGNDTEPLQAAINATPSGGKLRIVAGDCRVTGLIINKPITIVGDGFGALTSGKNSSRYVGGTQISPYGAVNGYLISVERGAITNDEGKLFGVILSDIYFEGGQRVSATGGIQLSNLDHSYFHNLRFDSFQRSAISLKQSVRETTFDVISTKFCGNNTVDGYDPVHNFPAISIIDVAPHNSDGTNQIKFNNTNIVYSLGDSVVIDSLAGAHGGVRQITFRDTMFHGLLPVMAAQIPGAHGVIKPRQARFSHVISSADKVSLLGGNITFMGADAPAIIQQASSDGTNSSPRMRVSDYWIQARYNHLAPTHSAYGVLLAAGYVSLSNLLIDDNPSGLFKTLRGTTIDLDWSGIKIGSSGSRSSSIGGGVDSHTSSYTAQKLDKIGMSYTYGLIGAEGGVPDGSRQTSTLNFRVSNDSEGVYGGQLGFSSSDTEHNSQPWWRSNIQGAWGAWRKLATENAIVNIVPITSYEQVMESHLSAYAVTKAMTYFSGIPAASFLLSFPAANAAIDGVTITVVSSEKRASVSFRSTGATFVGAPKNLSAGSPVKFQYLHKNAQWWITQ